MLKHALINLSADISVLQRYVAINQEQGLSNILRLLESLSISLLKASHGYSLVNKSLFAKNFLAIDLADWRIAFHLTTRLCCH